MVQGQVTELLDMDGLISAQNPTLFAEEFVLTVCVMSAEKQLATFFLAGNVLWHCSRVRAGNSA